MVAGFPGALSKGVVGGARGPHHAPPLVEHGLEPPARAPHTWRYLQRAVIPPGVGGERAVGQRSPHLYSTGTDSPDMLIEYDWRGATNHTCVYSRGRDEMGAMSTDRP